jgi:hypothetical protein
LTKKGGEERCNENLCIIVKVNIKKLFNLEVIKMKKIINKKAVTKFSIFLISIVLIFTLSNLVVAQEKHETLKVGFAFDITSMGAEWFLPELKALKELMKMEG